jgi:hypothetical protein
VLIERPLAREETDAIPLLWQADLLSVSRSRLYSEPRSAREQKIRIKHCLDEWYTQRPCLGSRKLVTLLAQDGLNVSRHTIRRYRAEMGLATLYPKQNLSRPSPVGHRVYPLPAAGATQRAARSSLGRRHYIHPPEGRLLVSGSIPGLVLAAGDGLGTLEHSGDAIRLVLCGSGLGASCPRDHQQRPGQPLHE